MKFWQEKSWAEHVQTKVRLSIYRTTGRQLRWPDGGSGQHSRAIGSD